MRDNSISNHSDLNGEMDSKGYVWDELNRKYYKEIDDNFFISICGDYEGDEEISVWKWEIWESDVHEEWDIMESNSGFASAGDAADDAEEYFSNNVIKYGKGMKGKFGKGDNDVHPLRGAWKHGEIPSEEESTVQGGLIYEFEKLIKSCEVHRDKLEKYDEDINGFVAMDEMHDELGWFLNNYLIPNFS